MRAARDCMRSLEELVTELERAERSHTEHKLLKRNPADPQLPIYSSPDDERVVTLVVTPNPLTDYITTGREAAQGVLGEARETVQKGVQSWVGFERNVERE